MNIFPGTNILHKILMKRQYDEHMNMQQNKNPKDIVTDPVCGMRKAKTEMKTKSIFLGKTYYFCSQTDQGLFDAHPDYWIPQEERDKARSI